MQDSALRPIADSAMVQATFHGLEVSFVNPGTPAP